MLWGACRPPPRARCPFPASHSEPLVPRRWARAPHLWLQTRPLESDWPRQGMLPRGREWALEWVAAGGLGDWHTAPEAAQGIH